jgi:hypothetical protein
MPDEGGSRGMNKKRFFYLGSRDPAAAAVVQVGIRRQNRRIFRVIPAKKNGIGATWHDLKASLF